MKDRGYPYGLFVGMSLVLHLAVAAHEVAVIRKVHRNRVVPETIHVTHRVEHPADVFVQVLDHGVVCGQPRSQIGLAAEIRAGLQGRGIEAHVVIRCFEGPVGRLYAQDEKERPVPVVVLEVRDGHVGQRVGLVTRQARGVHVAFPIVESLERRVVHLESVPVLETAPVDFRRARRRFQVIVSRVAPHLRRDLVAHRPAVPLAEIGGMVAGFPKQGCRTRRRRLVHVVKSLHRPGVGVAARENGAPRRRAHGTVGPGVRETHAPPRPCGPCWGSAGWDPPRGPWPGPRDSSDRM